MIVFDSTPYAWPFDGTIVAGTTALVICGAVGEWATQTPESLEVEENIDRLRSAASTCGILVVLAAQPAGEVAAGWAPNGSTALSPLPGEQVVHAAGIDAFYGSHLDMVLHRSGRTHLVFAGRGFETTVHSTLRRANDRGYECLTVSDACAALDPRLRAASVSTIEMSGGIFGAVASAASVLHALSVPVPAQKAKEDQ